jgi:nitroreductase
MALSAKEVNELKQAPPVEGVLPIVLQRWSARSYADREVPLSELEKIFEATRWTASARNEQPWRFIVGARNSLAYNKMIESMMDFTKPWASTAPVLILSLAKTTFSLDGSFNPFHLYDLGAAATTIMLQAASQGLATRTLGSFYGETLRKAFMIPEDFVVGTIIAVGYQGDPAALLSEQMIDMETSSRSRKLVNEFVFSDWDEPVKFA